MKYKVLDMSNSSTYSKPSVSYALTLKKLEPLFTGAQTLETKEKYSYMFPPSLCFKKELEFSVPPAKGVWRNVVKLPQNIPFACFKNLRTNIPDHMIQRVDIYIGGQVIDSIENIINTEGSGELSGIVKSVQFTVGTDVLQTLRQYNVFRYFRKLFGITDDSIIPFYCLTEPVIASLAYQDIEVRFTFSNSDFGFDWNTAQVTIDTCRTHHDTPTFSKMIYSTRQWYMRDRGDNDAKLCFNHIVYGLLVVGTSWTPERHPFALYLNGERLEIPDSEMIEMDSGVYYIHLYNGLNFSKIDNCTIKEFLPQAVFAVHSRIVNFQADIFAGFRFAN